MNQIIQADKRTGMEVGWAVSLSPNSVAQVLRMEFACDYAAPRPAGWDGIAPFIAEMGFELTRDFDGSAELFAPTSFFSAQALILASKAYPGDPEAAARSDLRRIQRFLAEAGDRRVPRTGLFEPAKSVNDPAGQPDPAVTSAALRR